MRCLAVVVLGLVGVLAAQTAPSAAAVFKEAQAAAARLPTPVAELELSWILHDELAVLPKQALIDYRSLYTEVHAWPAAGSTAEEKYLAELRFDIEGDAINAFAAQGQFQQALTWLAACNPGRTGASPAFYYSNVIRKMIANGDLAEVESTIHLSVGAGAGYPYRGAAAALTSKLPVLDREAIAGAGVAAAETAAGDEANSADELLAQVHAIFPRRDGQVEDATLALLKALQSDATQHPALAPRDDSQGAKLLGLLQQIDPGRTQEARAAFPGTASVASNRGVVLQLSAVGQPIGRTFGPSATDKLLATAYNDPDAAVADAAKLHDPNAKFAALATLAHALAKSQPRRAQQVADAAADLLDKDVAQAEPALVVSLAQAYQTLGETAKAAAIASGARDAAARLGGRPGIVLEAYCEAAACAATPPLPSNMILLQAGAVRVTAAVARADQAGDAVLVATAGRTKVVANIPWRSAGTPACR